MPSIEHAQILMHCLNILLTTCQSVADNHILDRMSED